MATPKDVLDIARSELGITEQPPESNHQKFGQWYGFDGVPWCAEFVSYCFYNAGIPLPTGGFVLTETGLYDGWRGQVNDENMANDFLWLEQRLQEDDYVRGQMIFGLGVNGRFWNFDLQSTTVPDRLGVFGAAHAGTV